LHCCLFLNQSKEFFVSIKSIKKIVLSVLLSGALLQCDGAMQSKFDLKLGNDLEYGNLTIEDLEEIQRHVAHELQQRERNELEKYCALIRAGMEFDGECAVKVACEAWKKALCPKQQQDVLRFLVLLVKNGLAYELATQAAQFAVQSIESKVQEAAFDVYIALVKQNCGIEPAKQAVKTYHPSFDDTRNPNANCLIGPMNLRAYLAQKGHIVEI
jgi:hypothetical protein